MQVSIVHGGLLSLLSRRHATVQLGRRPRAQPRPSDLSLRGVLQPRLCVTSYAEENTQVAMIFVALRLVTLVLCPLLTPLISKPPRSQNEVTPKY